MTLAGLNALDQPQFIHKVGWVCEHSPWVAERAWHSRPFGSIAELHASLVETLDRATREEQLALIRAHPDLGTRAKISDASVGEQAGAGLDQLTPEEHARLTGLNESYQQKFGFPFLFAVKGSDKFVILENLQLRLNSTPEDEFREALRQVARIVRFRLEGFIN